MGTRVVPSYANCFMGHLEERVLNYIDNKPDIWWKFIDDVFMVWPFGEGCLNGFFRPNQSFSPYHQVYSRVVAGADPELSNGRG